MTGKKVGRPTDFCKEVADEICERLSKGQSLRTIEKDDLMPSARTIHRWLDKEENKEFRQQYARACEDRYENIADEMFEIADDGSNDLMTIEKGDNSYEVENKEVTNRSKLRVQLRQWYLGKVMPKKYGDKVDVAHSGMVRTKIIRDDID